MRKQTRLPQRALSNTGSTRDERGLASNDTSNSLDGDSDIDWNRLPQGPALEIDYPHTFFDRLRTLEVGVPGQRVLDLGTGTGMLARGLARQGCEVTGIDVSEQRLILARRFAEAHGLNIDFCCASAEKTGIQSRRFDLIAASNAWWYFAPADAAREIKRLLAPEGRLLICGYRPLPDRQDIARQTRELLREFDIDIEADEPEDDGDIPSLPSSTRQHFAITGRVLFEEDLRLTRDQWRWQILSRPDVACGLSSQEQADLDQKLGPLLPQQGETFDVTYRMFAVILGPSERSHTTGDP